MKCPLSNYVMERESGEDEVLLSDCLKEECGWWLDDISMCAIRDLALELRYIQLRLAELIDKMPHEEQFRK